MTVVRLLTWNVHSCRGTDGRLDPGRIAAVIAEARVDIVALQELDVGRRRSGHVDQAHKIAEALAMRSHFHPAIAVEEERYGDAILTALPCRRVKAATLSPAGWSRLHEPRGALWCAVHVGGGDVGGRELQVITTHLGLLPAEQAAQAEVLLGPDWIGGEACREPVVLLGDLNLIPRSATYRRLACRLRDAQAESGRKPKATFPSRWPILRIDHAFLRGPAEVRATGVIATPLARKASDHLPLVVEIALPALPGLPDPPRKAEPLGAGTAAGTGPGG